MTREDQQDWLCRLRSELVIWRMPPLWREKFTEALNAVIKELDREPCTDAIRRQDALDAFGLSEKTRKYGGDHSGYDPMMLYEIQNILEELPSVNPKPCEDAISRQAAIGVVHSWLNIEGYSWGEKNVMICTINELRDLPSVSTETTNRCEDAISRTDAIRVASGYCHWTNIPDELAKLPPVTQTPKNVNDVLDEIKADLQTLADDEWNQQVMAGKGLEFAIEIIENYQMAMMEGVEE